MSIQNTFKVSYTHPTPVRAPSAPCANAEPARSPADVNLERIMADLTDARLNQAKLWQIFASKVSERDALGAAGQDVSRIQREVDAVEAEMNAAAELSNRLGALSYVFRLGGFDALARVTLVWADKDERAELASRKLNASVVLG